MLSSYPGRHMSLPRLEPSTSEKRWVSVANWATPVGFRHKWYKYMFPRNLFFFKQFGSNIIHFHAYVFVLFQLVCVLT
ncbi:hypothetical protein Hanom_Chr07g00638381 [Helianthus anomalus]